MAYLEVGLKVALAKNDWMIVKPHDVQGRPRMRRLILHVAQ